MYFLSYCSLVVENHYFLTKLKFNEIIYLGKNVNFVPVLPFRRSPFVPKVISVAIMGNKTIYSAHFTITAQLRPAH